jgi:vacuolar-type H+-ATPase catalytic subunit A/Vma1
LTINSPVIVAENMIGVAMYELVSFPHSMKMQVADDVLLRLKLAMTIW